MLLGGVGRAGTDGRVEWEINRMGGEGSRLYSNGIPSLSSVPSQILSERIRAGIGCAHVRKPWKATLLIWTRRTVGETEALTQQIMPIGVQIPGGEWV